MINKNNQDFLDAVSEKMDEIKNLAAAYGLEDDWCHAFIGGVWSKNEDSNSVASLQTVMDYNVHDVDELDQILTISSDYFQEMQPTRQSYMEHLPADLTDTADWTDEDWMKFIEDNTSNGEVN